MASGKSTLGKELAHAMHYTFLDLDDYIEKKEHKTVSAIFEKYGEPNFRQLEKKYLHETFSLQNTVIACGGGTPCFFDNIEQMNKLGITVWLQTDLDTIRNRVSAEKNKRPLLSKLNETQLQTEITKQLLERQKFYEKATYFFNTQKQHIKDLIPIFAK